MSLWMSLNTFMVRSANIFGYEATFYCIAAGGVFVDYGKIHVLRFSMSRISCLNIVTH